MRALPAALVPTFEEFVERLWCSRVVAPSTRRDALIVGLGLCGLRWVEVSRVLLRDLVVADGSLEVRTAKGGHRRTVDVGLSWVTGWLEMRRAMDYRGVVMWPTRDGTAVRYEQVRRRVKKWTEQHFGQASSFHCLRHTAAVRMYEATGSVVAVQRYLGHKSLQHTTTYLATVVPSCREGAPGFVERAGPALRVYQPDIDVSADRTTVVETPAARPAGLSLTVLPAPPAGTVVGDAIQSGSVAKAAQSGIGTDEIEREPKRRRRGPRVPIVLGCDECSKAIVGGIWGEDGKLVQPFRFMRSSKTGRFRVDCRLCGMVVGYLSDANAAAIERYGHI